MGDAASCACHDRDKIEGQKDPVPKGVEHMLSEGGANGSSASTNGKGFTGVTPRWQTPRPGTKTSLRTGETARQRLARSSLEQAKENPLTPRSLRLLLEEGQKAGLEAFELAEASEAVTRAERRKQAREALASAMASREDEALRTALRLADEANLDQREVEDAMALIEELEGGNGGSSEASQRAKAVVRLEAALKSRGRRDLEEAIAFAEAAGLGAKNQRALLAEVRVTLKIVNARRKAAEDRRARETEDGVE